MDTPPPQAQYSPYFLHAPVPLLEFDFSALLELEGEFPRSRSPEDSSPRGTFAHRLPGTTEDLAALVNRAKLRAVNHAALRLFRAISMEELQSALPKLIGEEGFSGLIEATEAIIEGRRYYSAETVNRDLEGRRMRILLSFSVLPEDAQQLERVLVAVEEITEYSQLQQEVQTLSLLPEANPNIVLIVDCDAGITYANPAALAWLSDHGFSYRGALYRLLPERFHRTACLDCNRRDSKQFKSSYDGREYDVKLKPLVGQRRCMITLTDVTEFEQLSRERAIYHEAFQSTIHAMVITDYEGVIEHVNPKFEELYGYSQEEARGRTPKILNPGRSIYRDEGYDEQAYEELFSDLWRSIKDPATGYWEGTVINLRRDGRPIWIRLTISAIYDRNGGISHFIGIPIDIDESQRRERRIRLDILKTITELAEMRDNETGRHIQRVGLLARSLAEELGMSAKYCSDIELFAQHHDIGKVGISDLILLAERRLTVEEFETMKGHTVLGYRLLAEKPTLEMAAEIAYSHHEHYNGGGYPRGLAGDAIPLCGRITAVVDVYDALRSRRPYKQAWNHADARAEILALSGSQFDPAIITAFSAREEEFRRIFTRYHD